jgi:hypothetical protein
MAQVYGYMYRDIWRERERERKRERERDVVARARAHTQALWDASSADEAVANLEALTVTHLDTWLQ